MAAAAACPAVVLFDLGGVLFRYAPERRWREFARLTGLEPDEVARRLGRSGFSSACDAGRLRGAAAHREGLRLLGQRLSLERFVGAWIAAFEPAPQVLAMARSIRTHAGVAILTNNSDLVRQGLEARFGAELDIFRPRIFSSDVGLTKPDPRLFEHAANLLGQPPERILLVDDSAANIASAASLGFQVHRFTDPPALERALGSAGLR
jgi:HAD superfamily hydrolase (TIGR01509 family)